MCFGRVFLLPGHYSNDYVPWQGKKDAFEFLDNQLISAEIAEQMDTAKIRIDENGLFCQVVLFSATLSL